MDLKIFQNIFVKVLIFVWSVLILSNLAATHTELVQIKDLLNDCGCEESERMIYEAPPG